MKKIFFLSLIFLFVITSSVEAVSGIKKVYLNPTGDSQISIDSDFDHFGSKPFFSTQSRYVDNGTLGLWGTSFTPDINAEIRFNLSSIPKGSFIKKASLKLYAYHVNADAPCQIYINRNTSDWDERWITYDNKPTSQKMDQYRYTVRNTGFVKSTGDEGWEITSLVNKWVSGEYKNYGIMIDNRTDADESLCKYYSKDETVAANQSKKPQLIVEYLPPLEITNISVPENQISSTVANVYWTSSIPILGVAYYQNGYTGNWAGKTNGNTLKTTDRVILSGLTPNTRYFYKIFGRDEINREKTTSVSSFITKTGSSFQRVNTSLGSLAGLIISPSPTPTPTPTPTPPQNEPNAGDINQQNQDNKIQILDLSYDISETTGTFSWTTKEEDGSAIMAEIKTSGFVYVSKNEEPTKDNHDFDFGKNQGEISHTVPLKYLDPGTTYNYLVYSDSDDGRIGTIKGIFTTKTIVGENADTAVDPQAGSGQNTGEGETSSGNQSENEPTGGQVAGQENFLRSLFDKLTNKNSPSTSNNQNLPLMILIGLVIVLIILVLTKRNKNNEVSSPKEEIKDVQKPPVKADKKIEPVTVSEPKKKGKGCLSKIILAGIILFVFWIVAGTLPFMFGPAMSPGLFIRLMLEEMGKNNTQTNTQKPGLAKGDKEAETSSSFAKISQGDTNNLSFSAINQTEWPKGTVGGLYKIEPSGSFSKLTSVTIDLKDNVQKGFALGYYHPDTKKWEYIPTIRIFGNTYKALITHASEVGGYAFGLSGALDYEPHFKNAADRAEWEALKSDLERVVQGQAVDFVIEGKLDRVASIILNNCASSKAFNDQMDYFFVWHLAQLLNLTKIDTKLGDNMNRCVDMQATRADSKYEYMIRESQDLKKDLNIPDVMQFAWKGKITHEGYPIVSGFDNRDWRTEWQVVARTEYNADVQYHWSMNFDLPTPEGTWGNGIVTHALLFSLKDVKEGQTFKIRGISIGDAPGYYRNWHEDLKWRNNHPVEQPTQSDPNKHVLDMTGTLVKDNGKAGAIIKYGGTDSLSKEQKTQMDAAMALIKNSGLSQFQGIPAYFQELAPEMKLNIIKGNPYNE